MKARDLISANESAVVIFTDGRDFRIEEDGTGSTGNWKLDPRRNYDKVIIYNRDRDTNTNVIYVAVPTDIHQSRDPERRVIEFVDIRRVGTTEKNWLEFAESGQNPIRYLP